MKKMIFPLVLSLCLLVNSSIFAASQSLGVKNTPQYGTTVQKGTKVTSVAQQKQTQYGIQAAKF